MATADAGYAGRVTVKLDLGPAEAEGAAFFRAYQRNLVIFHGHVLVACLRVAQAFAPVGSRDFVIEDAGGKGRRSGHAPGNSPANPAGFATQPGTGSDDPVIRKSSGGTLRRALSLAQEVVGAELIRGTIGVAPGSAAEKYARMRELGGTISAKKGRYLRYSPDGQVIVFKPVVHQDPHPYLLPALLYAWPLLQEVPVKAFEAAKMEAVTGLVAVDLRTNKGLVGEL